MRKEFENGVWFEEFVGSGLDQAYVDFPCVFPTATIAVMCSDDIWRLADKIIAKDGYDPIFDNDDAWFNFYVEINGYTDTHISSYILFSLNTSDICETFTMDIDRDEQEAIYQSLSDEIDIESCLKDVQQYEYDMNGECSTILDRRTA